jgi:CBS domain-containing protein
MNAECTKVQRIAIWPARGGAVVSCPRRREDIDVSQCQSCEHCIGLSARDAYLVCGWRGQDAQNSEGRDHPMKRANDAHTPQNSRPHAASTSGPQIAAVATALSRFERPVITATLDDTVFDVACRMRDDRVGCVVVVRDGRPVGILTDRDIVLRVVAQGLDARVVLVSSIVTYEAMTIMRTDGFETAVRTMREHGVRRVPIVDADGRVTGIVTADDLVALLGRELAALGEAIAENVDGSESR